MSVSCKLITFNSSVFLYSKFIGVINSGEIVDKKKFLFGIGLLHNKIVLITVLVRSRKSIVVRKALQTDKTYRFIDLHRDRFYDSNDECESFGQTTMPSDTICIC